MALPRALRRSPSAPARRAARLALAPLALVALPLACGGDGAGSVAGARGSLLAHLHDAKPARAPRPAPPPARADASLLPRSALFGNPDRTLVRPSPDGASVSWLAADEGVLNVFVAPTADPSKAKAVTKDRARGVRMYGWAETSAHVLYVQDDGGDENWHLHAVDVATLADKDLTPTAGVQARLEGTSAKRPFEVLVGLNERDKRFHDLFRIDVRTGKRELVFENQGYGTVVADQDFAPRLGLRPAKDGSVDLVDLGANAGAAPAAAKAYATIPHEDTETTQPLGFDTAGKALAWRDSRGRDTAALVVEDFAKHTTQVLVDDGRADVALALLHPATRVPQAARASYERDRWHLVDPSLRADFDVFAAEAKGEVGIAGRSRDDKTWIVTDAPSDGPVRFFVYDRPRKALRFLFASHRALEGAKLATMHPRLVKARDGLELVTYLSLPPGSDADGDGVPDAPLPTVLWVHGGPWHRDAWGLSPTHQWLASRGYAVLSVNFRGSTGFGKKFLNAANLEWAGKMHDDLLDAVAWAEQAKIADPNRVAIGGGSYGGYATLVGLTFTPDRFACGVDLVGPSNLVTLLESIPPYWESEREQFVRRIGDPRTEEGKKLLLARSPVTRAGAIASPLLIGQGANDPRVKQAESDRIAAAAEKNGVPVTYLLYPGEGHGFARPENRTSFFAVAEVFLARCLGGAYQPLGKDLEQATFDVKAGRAHVPGL